MKNKEVAKIKIKGNKRDGVKYCNISDTLEQCPFYGNNKPRPFYSNGYEVMEKQKKLSKIKGFGYNMYKGDIIQ